MVKLKSMDKIDQDTILYQQGFQAGVEHQKMSPETARHFNELRTHNDQMYKMIENMHTFMFGVPEENNNGGFKRAVEELVIQTKKTNGRVNKLEVWKYGLITAYTVALSLVTFFVVNIAIPEYKELQAKVYDINERLIVITPKQK